MARAMKVAIVDDETDMRQSISQWLALSGFDTETYPSAEDALKSIGADFSGVVVSDIKMPGMDGMAFLKKLMSLDSGLPVIMITGHGDVPMAVEQMKRGAVDFLQKPVSAVPLQAALEHALQVSAAAFSRQEIICCYQQLTPKERELAHLVAKGLMNREIADAMNIAVRTVEVHRARVMEKMQAGSLAELVNRLQRVQ